MLGLGYEILESNLRVENSEIDLIAHDTKFDEIVFVEVKARKTSFFGNPSQAVSKLKLKSMSYVAHRYLKSKRFNKNFRFDIITISEKDIEHFENITWP